MRLPGTATQHRLQPGNAFERGERFRDEVVGAEIEAGNAIRLGPLLPDSSICAPGPALERFDITGVLRPRSMNGLLSRHDTDAGVESKSFRCGQSPGLDYAPHFDEYRNMKSTDVVRALGALAQESRLAVFRLLVKRGPDGYSPGDLAEKLRVSGPTLSFHLKELQHAQLIVSRRDGRFLYYSANFDQMNRLIDFLTENCCSMANDACGPGCAPQQARGKRP